MTQSMVPLLVCGCIRGMQHWGGLGEAERVATEAVQAAGPDGPILAALAALRRAGLLRDPDPADWGDEGLLSGLLDTLWEMDLIVDRSDVDSVGGGG